jgi:hypothetical protein
MLLEFCAFDLKRKFNTVSIQRCPHGVYGPKTKSSLKSLDELPRRPHDEHSECSDIVLISELHNIYSCIQMEAMHNLQSNFYFGLSNFLPTGIFFFGRIRIINSLESVLASLISLLPPSVLNLPSTVL